MKNKLQLALILIAMLLAGDSWGQTQPGDIAFIALNADEGDDFAFVTLVDIPASSVIYFTDNEWNGSAFNDLNEGELTWTNDASILSAGSVVVFTDPINSSTRSINFGTISGAGWEIGGSNEWAYALLEEPATNYASTPTFLAAIATDAGENWLLNTELTEGTHAIDFNNDHDGFKYTDSRNNQTSFSDYLSLIYNASNWQDETSDGEFILPISTTSFSLSETPALLISASPDLNEGNLNSSIITLDLSNETFTDPLTTTDFTLNNSPTTTTISGTVNRISDTQATMTLAFTGTDFDTDISDFNVTAEGSALTGGSPLTSNNLSIEAFKAPNATTESATATTNGNATLNGTITTNGYSTTVTFEYGTTDSYGTTVTASESPLTSDGKATYQLTGLSNNTEYHYRVVAENTEGTTEGADQTFTPIVPPTIIISEVTHPSDVASAKFVEIYNYSSSSIDLSAESIYLVRQTNGASYGNIALTGSIAAEACFVIACYEKYYLEEFGKSADQYCGTVSGNGDDGYFLYVGGDQTTGTLFDAYGVPDEDGTDKDWDYVDSKAVRKTTVSAANSTWTASEWNIIGATTERMSPGLYPASVWNGTIDNNWTEPDNWDNGLVETNFDAVIWGEATNFPDLTTTTSINNLLFNHNAQLNGQEFLSLTGSLYVLHQITESTSNTDLDHWQYFTTPFTNTTSANLLSSNDRVDLWILGYDNNISNTINNAWSTIENSTTTITPGKGYAVSFVNDETETGNEISGTDYNMILSGTLVNASSNTTVALSYQGPEETDNNWNLIGNPYLAAIDWYDNTNLDYSLIQGSAAYIYDPTAGNYITIQSDGTGSGTSIKTGFDPETVAGSQYIPPMQGFFVEASSTGTFEIDKYARTDESYDFYKSATQQSLVRIQVEHDSLFDETIVIYNTEGSTSFDRYDAHKLLANSPCPQIFTQTKNSHKLVFNHTNSLKDSINLYLITKTAGEYQLKLSEISGDFEDCTLLLEDTQNKVLSYLREDIYTFTAEKDTTYQFNLYLQNRTEISQFDLSTIKVFASDKNIIVNSHNNINGTIKVYDSMGRYIRQTKIEGKSAQINMGNRSGLFIVQIEGEKTLFNYKLTIK
jgi:hypothetical protein